MQMNHQYYNPCLHLQWLLVSQCLHLAVEISSKDFNRLSFFLNFYHTLSVYHLCELNELAHCLISNNPLSIKLMSTFLLRILYKSKNSFQTKGTDFTLQIKNCLISYPFHFLHEIHTQLSILYQSAVCSYVGWVLQF